MEEANKQKVACVSNIGDYDVPVSIFVERCLGYKMMKCPSSTKKTVEIGSKNSPDTVCTPFKVILGNYIEALNKGANVLIIPAIGCRLGFYDVLQKKILEDLQYDFEILNLFEYANNANAAKIYRLFTEKNPQLTEEKFNEVLSVVVRIVIDMDKLADYARRNTAFEVKKGEFERLYKTYLAQARLCQDVQDAAKLGEKFWEAFRNVEVKRPDNPLRIGLVGDLYTVIEPHGNCNIERWLTENGIEVVRDVNLTYLTKTLFDPESQVAKSGSYIKYYIGGNATGTIALAYEYASQNKVDGIIHMKAATCSPEITAMQILQNISKDFNLPVVYLTFDTETSEAGLHTRLEAFKDMLEMKR